MGPFLSSELLALATRSVLKLMKSYLSLSYTVCPFISWSCSLRSIRSLIREPKQVCLEGVNELAVEKTAETTNKTDLCAYAAEWTPQRFCVYAEQASPAILSALPYNVFIINKSWRTCYAESWSEMCGLKSSFCPVSRRPLVSRVLTNSHFSLPRNTWLWKSSFHKY